MPEGLRHFYNSDIARRIRQEAFCEENPAIRLEVPFMGRHVQVGFDYNRFRANLATKHLHLLLQATPILLNEHPKIAIASALRTASKGSPTLLTDNLDDLIPPSGNKLQRVAGIARRKFKKLLGSPDQTSGIALGYDIALSPMVIAKETEAQISKFSRNRSVSYEEGAALLKRNLERVLAHEEEHYMQLLRGEQYHDNYTVTEVIGIVLLLLATIGIGISTGLELTAENLPKISDKLFYFLNDRSTNIAEASGAMGAMSFLMTLTSGIQYRLSKYERAAFQAERQIPEPEVISPFSLTFVQ